MNEGRNNGGASPHGRMRWQRAGLALVGFAVLSTSAAAQVRPPFTRPVENTSPNLRGRFGDAVAHGARVLAVGAPGDSIRGVEAGSVHIFEQDVLTGAYTLGQVLQPPGLLPYDRFGDAVALAGNVLVVGSTGDDDAAPNAGAAYVYARAGIDEPFLFLAKVTAPSSHVGVGDAFGHSVAVFGSRVAVGAPKAYSPAYQGGVVFLFDVDATGGVVYPAGLVTDPGTHVGDGFGASVALGFDRVYVGAERFDPPSAPVNAGGVLVFEESVSGSWVLTETLVSPAPQSFAEFGHAIALDPPRGGTTGTLVVGEPFVAQAGQVTPRGAVHVFEAGVAMPWAHVFDFGLDVDQFNTERGLAVAVQSGVALAAAPGLDSGRGGVDVLERQGPADWAATDTLLIPGSAANDRAGTGLALFNGIPVVGAPGRDGLSGSDEGWAWTSSLLWAGLGTVDCAPAVPNSTDTFASLAAGGSLVAADNLFRLEGGYLPPGQFALPLVGSDAAHVPGAGGAVGVLCIGGSVGRFNQDLTQVAPDGRVTIPLDLSAVPLSSTTIAVAAGETWHFQLWYRDLDPAQVSNYSSAIGVTFD